MVLTNSLLLGGAAYAYLSQLRKSSNDDLVTPEQSTLLLQKQTEDAQHYVAMSTLSLGLTVAGSLSASPLALLSIPINVYANIPLFEESISTLRGKSDRFSSILWSFVLGGTLASNALLTANTLHWFVQRSRLAGARMRQNRAETSDLLSNDVQQWIGQALGRKPSEVWVVYDQTELEIRFEDLIVGDQILVRQREFIPVTGEVVRGEADVFDWSNFPSEPRRLTVGDQVTPRMLLLTGALYINVEELE